MLKILGASVVLCACALPAHAGDAVQASCREEARGLKGAEYEHYVRVCVVYERTVQALRGASACRPAGNNGASAGVFQARACVAQATR